MVGLGIIAAMIVAGGFIAFLGDRVGMKVGKKRLSIFGLRPKYTSMIITVLSGFLIAGVTLIILTVMSEYARTAIFKLNTIQDNLKEATARVNILREILSNKQKDISQKEAQYKILSAKAMELQNQYRAAQMQKLRLETEKSQVERQYRDAREQYSAALKDLNISQERLDSQLKVINDLARDITVTSEKLTQADQRLTELNAQIKDQEDKLSSIQGEPVIFFVGEVLSARVIGPGMTAEKIRETIVEPLLQEANKLALKRGAKIPGKPDYALKISPKQITDVSTKLAGIKDKAILRVVVDKNSVTGEPVTVDLELFLNELIFKDGEVIDELIVSGNTPASDLRDQLLGLILRASAKASNKGIVGGWESLRDSISVGEMAQYINMIKKTPGGRFKAGIVAVGNIYRVDPLKVKFVITPLTLEGQNPQ